MSVNWGDMIGSRYEFCNTKSMDFELFTEWTKFTDDSVMMLAIKKAIIEGSDLVDTMVSVGRQYPYCGCSTA